MALIKITYVSELQVEGELINFSVPGSVAPWKQETGNTEVREINLLKRTSIYVTGSVLTNCKFRFFNNGLYVYSTNFYLTLPKAM